MRIRPILSYYGGKTDHADWINGYLAEAASAYVEVFTGSAAVGLSRPRAKVEVFNDLDPGVANLYRVVQSDPEELQTRLRFTLHSRREHALCSAAERERRQGTYPDPVEWARQHLVLVRQSFSAGFDGSWGYTRQSRGSSFRNVADLIPPVARRLRGAVIENLHFRNLIEKYRGLGPDAVWYLDPPYLPQTRTGGKVYRCEMSRGEHVELLHLIKGIEGSVVLSGYPSMLYDDALDGWHRVTKDVPCFASSGTRSNRASTKPRRTEVLWVNPRAVERLAQRVPHLRAA
jgi:DNA adenine methylase